MSIMYTPEPTMEFEIAARFAVRMAALTNETVILSFNEKQIQVHPELGVSFVIKEFDRLNAEKGGSA